MNGAPISLRRRLAFVAAASSLPMLLAFAAEAYVQYHAERMRAGQHQLDVARSMAATLDRELGGAIASLQALALSPRLQVGDLPGFRTLALRFMATQADSSGLVLLDQAGQHLVNTGFAPGQPLPRRNAQANEAVTRTVFRTAQPVVSDLFPRARDGSLIVTADVPVLREGQVIYDLSLVLPVDHFTRIIADQHLEPGTVSSIYDRHGVHVARLPSPDRYTGEPARPDAAESYGQHSGGGDGEQLDGGHRTAECVQPCTAVRLEHHDRGARIAAAGATALLARHIIRGRFARLGRKPWVGHPVGAARAGADARAGPPGG